MLMPKCSDQIRKIATELYSKVIYILHQLTSSLSATDRLLGQTGPLIADSINKPSNLLTHIAA